MPSEWELFFDKCIREMAKEVIILDVGSGNPFQKEMKKYKQSFENCKYYSLDFTIKYKPHIIGDIHHLPFKDESIDAIICKAVLEHVPEPQNAVREVYRVLREGGKILVYVPFLYPYHGGEDYRDYYRFTKDGVKYMFRDFQKVEIAPVRGFCGTINLFIPPKISSIANFLDKFIHCDVTSGYNIFAIR